MQKPRIRFARGLCRLGVADKRFFAAGFHLPVELVTHD
jgi:hypothetical protein